MGRYTPSNNPIKGKDVPDGPVDNSEAIEQPKPRHQATHVHSASIVKQIVNKLGRPKNLIKFTVTNIAGNSFRVNAWVDPNRPNISDSFFIRLSNDGNIETCEPNLIRRY